MSWISILLGFLGASGLGGLIVAGVNQLITIPATRLKGLPTPLATAIAEGDTLLIHTVDGGIAAITGTKLVAAAAVPPSLAAVPTLADVAATATVAATTAANIAINKVLPSLLATPARHVVDGAIDSVGADIAGPVAVTNAAVATPPVNGVPNTPSAIVAPPTALRAALPTLKPLTPVQQLQAQQASLAAQIATAQAEEKAATITLPVKHMADNAENSTRSDTFANAAPTDSPPPFSGV